jgi:hypothetical protein
MKMRGWLAASVVLLVAGCGGVHWQEYTSADGGFSVVMPGTPKKESHTVETPQGPITFNATVVELPHGAFVASWADLPPKIPMDLDKSVRQIAARYKGEVKEVRDDQFEGSPGKAFVLKTERPSGGAEGRIYQVKNRLYLLLAVGSDVKGKGSRETERFFSTFKLNSPLMKPETTTSP